GDHERGKDLPEGRVVPPPADPNELEQSPAPLDFSRVSPRAPALRIASGEHEPRHALGMTHRVDDRDGGALGVAEKREASKIKRVGHPSRSRTNVSNESSATSQSERPVPRSS